MQNKNNGKKQPICFKQWTRKAYGIFNSLHREIKIATLVLSYTLLVRPVAAKAQGDTVKVAEKYEIETVEVPGQRGPGVYSQAARVVSVITRAEIAAAPVASIQDVIGYALNADVRTRGGNGVQADISIRGGTFDQVIVLLNGVNVSDPQTGHHALNLPVDISMIERVEVLNGPAARVYGGNAFTGAINIVTSAGNRNSVNAGIEGGDFGYLKSYANGSVKLGKTVQKIGFSGATSDGYTKNTDFKQLNAFYQVHTDFDANNSVDFQAGYGQKDFGALEYYSPAYPWQYESTKNMFGSLRFKTGSIAKVNSAVYFRRHYDRFELYREGAGYYHQDTSLNQWVSTELGDTSIFNIPHNYHLTDVFGSSITGSYNSKIGVTSLGADIRSENILSTKLGFAMGDTVPIAGVDGKSYTLKYQRTYFSYFLEHTLNYRKIFLNMGLMGIWNSDLENEMHLYPGIDVSYQVLPGFKLMANYNQSLRMPTFTDMFFVSGDLVGDPYLKPEQSRTAEIGVKYQHTILSTLVTYFNTFTTDKIDWQFNTGTNKFYARNIAELTTNGLEGQIIVNTQGVGGNYQPVNKVIVNYALLDISSNLNQPTMQSDSVYESRYALDFLKHNLSVRIDHKLISNLSAVWSFTYQERMGSYRDWSIIDKGYFKVDNKPSFLVDVRLNWMAKKYTVFAEATNLFDKDYHDLGSIPQPGRWVKAGVSLHL